MTKVFKVNLYFLMILLLEVLGPYALRPLYIAIGLNDTRLILFFNHVILFIVPAIIYLIVTKSSFKETLRLNKLHWQDTLLIILLGFIVQPVMTFFSLISTFFFENEVGSFINEISSTPYILLLGLVAILPSITEEITIRGVVLDGYNNVNKYIAAMVTGLFFGILHLDGQQFLYAAILGFIFALVVRITNSIYASMIMHFIINGTSVTIAKISNLVSESLPITKETVEFNLKNISASEKLLLITVYGSIAIIFSVLVFLIIYGLNKMNQKRKIKENKFFSEDIINEDKILNIPFILIILVYFIIMFITV